MKKPNNFEIGVSTFSTVNTAMRKGFRFTDHHNQLINDDDLSTSLGNIPREAGIYLKPSDSIYRVARRIYKDDSKFIFIILYRFFAPNKHEVGRLSYRGISIYFKYEQQKTPSVKLVLPVFENFNFKDESISAETKRALNNVQLVKSEIPFLKGSIANKQCLLVPDQIKQKDLLGRFFEVGLKNEHFADFFYTNNHDAVENFSRFKYFVEGNDNSIYYADKSKFVRVNEINTTKKVIDTNDNNKLHSSELAKFKEEDEITSEDLIPSRRDRVNNKMYFYLFLLIGLFCVFCLYRINELTNKVKEKDNLLIENRAIINELVATINANLDSTKSQKIDSTEKVIVVVGEKNLTSVSNSPDKPEQPKRNKSEKKSPLSPPSFPSEVKQEATDSNTATGSEENQSSKTIRQDTANTAPSTINTDSILKEKKAPIDSIKIDAPSVEIDSLNKGGI